MSLKKIILAVSAVIAIAAIAVILTYDRIVIYFIAKQYNLSMSYSGVKNANFRELIFTDLKAIDKKTGSGLFARQAKLWPSIGIQTSDSKALTFELKDVHFIPSKKDTGKNRDYLTDLVSMPFNEKWVYKELYGDIVEFEKGIFVKKLVATSDTIRLSMNGYLYKNNNIDANIIISFSKTLLNELPEDVSGAILKDEPGDWKSFSAHLAGNLKKPSIEITGKLFRLNIRQVE